MGQSRVFIALAAFMLVSLIGFSQSYVYPVKPGDEKWKSFKTGEEMSNACQLPKEVVTSLSTRDLVSTCLNYPLISTMYAYDNLQTGFEALTKKFNGFEELLKRKDSGTELLRVYSKMSPDSVNKAWTLEKVGSFTLEFSYIETMLAQYANQDKLSSEEKKRLAGICLQKFESKKAHIDIFANHGANTTAWVIGRVLKNQNLKEFSYPAASIFIERGVATDSKIIDEVLEKGKKYVK